MEELNLALPKKDECDRIICEDKSSLAHIEIVDSPIYFLMKDEIHEFSIGLDTILRCLSIAEAEGHVPKLPEEWWIKIATIM